MTRTDEIWTRIQNEVAEFEQAVKDTGLYHRGYRFWPPYACGKRHWLQLRGHTRGTNGIPIFSLDIAKRFANIVDMAIVKQVDADYEGDPYVVFIESAPRYVKGPNVWDECVSGETYCAELHRRPSMTFVRSCRHEHRNIDPAVRCAKRLLKQARKEQP